MDKLQQIIREEVSKEVGSLSKFELKEIWSVGSTHDQSNTHTAQVHKLAKMPTSIKISEVKMTSFSIWNNILKDLNSDIFSN